MNKHAPPRLANWLLQHLLDERHGDALIGDLTELHDAGRSRGWYWRQVFIAITTSHISALRTHGISLVTALVAGWCVIVLWWNVNSILIHNNGDMYWWLRSALHDYQSPVDARNTARTLIWIAGALLRLACFGVAGWVVARLCPRKRMFAVVTLTATFLLWPLPWIQLRIFTELQWLIFHATAIAGVLVGASVASLRDSGGRTWNIGATPQP